MLPTLRLSSCKIQNCLSITGFATINPGYNVNSTIFGGTPPPVNGTLITNAQPYITSLGTLTGLTVNGATKGISIVSFSRHTLVLTSK